MSYPRNAASPPPLFATVVKAADDTAITSGVAAKYSTGAGSQAAGGGTCQHEGNGQWSYTPTQGETNVTAFGIQFYHADAVGSGPTISAVTSADVAQTGDVYAVVTNATYGLDKLARTGADSDTLKTLSDQLDAVETDTADIQTRLPAALVSGRVDASTGAMAANVVTAAALATDAITEIWAGSTAPNAATIASQVRMELATELARLDEDVSAGAHAGDAMTLVDDAITAAKYDQTTAHPLAQADAGSTAVARTGADGDTLKTLSDEIAGIETGSGLTAQETANAVHNLAPVGTPAANSIGDKLNNMPATILTTAVAAYAGTPGTFGYLLSLLAGLDFTAVNLVAASNAGEITIKRTLTLAAVVSGLTIPADWTACYWTVKRSLDDADADALVQILVSNPPDADDGLQVLAGAAVEDQTAGSLTVNQALGTVTIALDAASTAGLEDAVDLVWDVKVHAPGAKTQPGAGTATITTAVTRA